MTRHREREEVVTGPRIDQEGSDRERAAAPATWPRDPRERTQPRSRLAQALSVAGHGTDHRADGADGRDEPAPAGTLQPGAFQRAFSDILGPSDREEPAVTADTVTGTAAAPQARRVPDVAAPGPEHGVMPAAEPSVEHDPGTALAQSGRGTSHYGLGDRWGRSWRDSAQGWITTPSGEPVWRPVVATTGELASWDVDTYLGVVTAEVAIDLGAGDQRRMGATLARGREIGIEGLVEEAIERGAHAVIGVSMQYTPIEERLLLTVAGTAVTLRDKSGRSEASG